MRSLFFFKIVSMFLELTVSIESFMALVDGSLELVRNVLLVLLQDNFEASLVSGDNALAL